MGVAATALYMASVGSEFYVVTLLLQTSRGYPPLRAGLAFLPLAALVTLGSAVTGRAVRRFGAPAVLSAGFVLAALGLGWLAVASGGLLRRGAAPGAAGQRLRPRHDLHRDVRARRQRRAGFARSPRRAPC